MLSAVDVGEVLALIGLKNGELVGRIWVRAEERLEVKVGNGRSLLFETELGVLATQLD